MEGESPVVQSDKSQRIVEGTHVQEVGFQITSAMKDGQRSPGTFRNQQRINHSAYAESFDACLHYVMHALRCPTSIHSIQF